MRHRKPKGVVLVFSAALRGVHGAVGCGHCGETSAISCPDVSCLGGCGIDGGREGHRWLADHSGAEPRGWDFGTPAFRRAERALRQKVLSPPSARVLLP
jgi:hypothetical protein